MLKEQRTLRQRSPANFEIRRPGRRQGGELVVHQDKLKPVAQEASLPMSVVAADQLLLEGYDADGSDA